MKAIEAGRELYRWEESLVGVDAPCTVEARTDGASGDDISFVSGARAAVVAESGVVVAVVVIVVVVIVVTEADLAGS